MARETVANYTYYLIPAVVTLYSVIIQIVHTKVTKTAQLYLNYPNPPVLRISSEVWTLDIYVNLSMA